MRIIDLPPAHNAFYHLAGFGFLVLNKIRHSLQGYRNPRPFPISEIDRAIDYDISVVDHWTQMLSEYIGHPVSLEGRTILELGPGADLGVGLITLSLGAKKYNALDVNNLVASVPESFYEALFDRIKQNNGDHVDINVLRSQQKLTYAGSNDRLNYVVRDDFDITVFADEGIDTVFSQAAFEHFNDIPKIFAMLTRTVLPGTVLIAEIDLNTHTRWIRDIDPLNIYRYSDITYDLFRFAGSPNRIRPSEYSKALLDLGWENVQIKPLVRVGDQYLNQVRPRLARRFRSSTAEIEYLSAMLCATMP
jgi:ubiquinone/menaquinone biosynthesis C-methylase UbiE